MSHLHGYQSFGIPLASELPFPGEWEVGVPSPDATVIATGELPPWSGPTADGWQGMIDGERFVVARSAAGEHRFSHGGRTLFHLSADHQTLLGAPMPRSTGWWRVLLDSVLFTVGLLRGREALHAGAVATPVGAVAILAESGGGKSTLLSELLHGGCTLISDDILFLDRAGGQLLGHPGPPLMTLSRERYDGVGAPVGAIGDEIWLAVPVVSKPVPIRKVVVLDRRAGAPTAIGRITRPLVPLARHLLRYPHTRDRELARFGLASDLATNVEIWRVTADVETSPEQLASIVVGDLHV